MTASWLDCLQGCCVRHTVQLVGLTWDCLVALLQFEDTWLVDRNICFTCHYKTEMRICTTRWLVKTFVCMSLAAFFLLPPCDQLAAYSAVPKRRTDNDPWCLLLGLSTSFFAYCYNLAFLTCGAEKVHLGRISIKVLLLLAPLCGSSMGSCFKQETNVVFVLVDGLEALVVRLNPFAFFIYDLGIFAIYLKIVVYRSLPYVRSFCALHQVNECWPPEPLQTLRL